MKKVLLFVAIGLMLLAIPATIFFLGQQRDIRAKAAPATILSLDPPSQTVNVGDTFKLNVTMTPGSNQVVSAQIYLTYDPTKLTATSITNGSNAPNVLNSGVVGNGTASISVGAASNAQPITTTGPIAIVTFTAIGGTTAIAPADIQFASNTFVGGINDTTANVLQGTAGAKITINGTSTTNTLTSTVTPTLTPTGTITPTPTALSCSQGLSDNFSSASLDTTKWINTWKASSLSTITQTGGLLTITSASPSAATPQNTGVASKTIIGDFSMETTISGFQSTPTNNGSAELSIGGDFTWISLAWRKNGSGSTVRSYIDLNSTASKGGQNVVNGNFDVGSATSLKLKLTRTGSSAQGYVDTGTGYQLVGTIPNAYSGDGYMQLEVFDFSNSSGNTSSANFDNFSFGCVNSASSSAVTIISPGSNASMASTEPIIKGTAPPGSSVTIVIHSTPQTVVVTVDANGNWTYTPTTPLDAGPHTVTASVLDASGTTQTASNSFVVSAGSGLGGGSASDTAMPVSGNVESTILLISLGVVLLTAGALIPIFVR